MKDNLKISENGNSGPVMADVARHAGVAVSTVSRALANPERVNAKTREKIKAAALALGYTPNAAARNLRVGRSNTVMIILAGSLHYGVSQLIPQLLQSINQTLVRQGYNLMIANLDRDAHSERHILDLAFGGMVRGAITISSPPPTLEGRSLADAGLPIVSLLQDLSGQRIHSVCTNDRTAVRAATEALIALGHRRFLYISGPEGDYHDVERLGGLREAVENAGLDRDAVIRSGGTLSYQHGFRIGIQAVLDFEALADKPTAVIATSDDMAIAFMSGIQARGVRVPEDLSVVSFDGSPVCEYCHPPLATITQPVEEMGQAAVRTLLHLLDGDDTPMPMCQIVPSRLIRRTSMAEALPVRAKV